MGDVNMKVWIMTIAAVIGLSMLSSVALAQGKNVIRLEAIKVEGPYPEATGILHLAKKHVEL